MSTIRDLMETLDLEIESAEGLLLAARAHLSEVRRNGWSSRDAQATVDALERKLKTLRDHADELRRMMH
jgi:hypothetical protein